MKISYANSTSDAIINAEANRLLEFIKFHGGKLVLTGKNREILSSVGVSRREVHYATNKLLDAGIIKIIYHPHVALVLIPPGDRVKASATTQQVLALPGDALPAADAPD